MNYTSILCVILLGVSTILVSHQPSGSVKALSKKWPKPIYDFTTHPVSDEGFELGRALFYDPILSRDSTISCAACHLQYTGFAHVDHTVSHGIDGRKGTRNAPALINLAWKVVFHWDGGVTSLPLQFINPIEHPLEMDNQLSTVIRKLQGDVYYRKLFSAAYGSDSITSKRLLDALAQFVVSLESKDAKYDRVMRKEKGIYFTEQEKNGYRLFQNNCNACHTEPLFTNTFFASNGLPVDPQYNDLGRYAITNRTTDSFQFMIPTLRNTEFTFPYMHDGRFRKLKDVIQHYTQINTKGKQLHPILRKKITFNDQEQKDLIAFLKTLSDRTFLYNTRFAFPKELLNARKPAN